MPLITEWTAKYSPAAGGDYAGKAYWVATEDWPDQNYPFDLGELYAAIQKSKFYIGGVPTYAIIGYQNKVFYNPGGGPAYDAANFWQAMDDAINSFPVAPDIPANVVTSVSGTDLIIDWDVSAGAINYDVYSSDDPYGTFTLERNVGTNQYTEPADQAKLFYYIIAKN